MTSRPLEAEQQRALDLIGLAGLDVAWREGEVVPEAADVGAAAGFRLLTDVDEHEVAVSIYLYERWGQGAEPGRMLEEMTDGDGYHARHVVNGAIMAFAVCPSDSIKATEIVDAVIAAVAGQE